MHDIEELSTACRKATTCPYFAARDLALEAELVFCPYTYLVDPVVGEHVAQPRLVTTLEIR